MKKYTIFFVEFLEKGRNNMKKFLTLTILLVLFCLTGCAELQEEETMIQNISECIPNAEYIKVEKDDGGEESNGGNIYYFKGKDFDFVVEDFIYSNPGGLPYNDQETDYYQKLLELKNDEINAIKEKYNFEIVIQDEWMSGLEIECIVNSFGDIKDSFGFCTDVYNLLKEHLPKETTELFPCECELNIRIEDVENEYGLYLNNMNLNFVQNQYKIKKEYVAFTEEYYVEKVRKGEITDFSVGSKHLEKYKPLTLNSIYINGNEFISERYEPEIIFNIMDGEYYLTIGYGIELEYNGGVEDFINREIIQEYYPNSKYSINKTSHYTTYKINGDKYKIVRNNNTDDYRFYKNGKEMDIKDYEKVTGYRAGAAYFRLVKAEDFAVLTGLKLVKIDYNSGIVYFETK